jgi:aquaporin Z
MSRYIAEFVGTFVLVFAGCGAAVLSGGQAGALGVAVAFGLALVAMVYAVGHVSGCHINPAVTLGLFISNKMPRKHAPGYWIAQIAGGIVAAGVLLVIARGMPGGYDPAVQGLAANGFGAHSPGHYNFAAAALTEFIFTFVLVITVIGATDIDAPVGFAGIPIGLALLLANLVAIPVTNASINPARSIGPAVFVGGWAVHQLWLFIVAPLLGGVAASGVYRLIEIPLLHAREAERARQGREVLPIPERPEQPERPRRSA